MRPLRREDLPELEELFAHYDATLSFVPNSLVTMSALSSSQPAPVRWLAVT